MLHNKKYMEIFTPFKVVAIDTSFKPNEVPQSKWIELNEVYTVVEVVKLNIQGLVGFKLKEIDLTGCEPYTYFRCSRFRFYVQEDELAEAKVKDLIGGLL